MKRVNTKKFLTRISQIFTDCPNSFFNPCQSVQSVSSIGEIEIRAAHEVMAARATQLALLVDQLMPALQTKPPMLAGNIFVRRPGAGIRRMNFNCCRVDVQIHPVLAAPRKFLANPVRVGLDDRCSHAVRLARRFLSWASVRISPLPASTLARRFSRIFLCHAGDSSLSGSAA